MYFFRNFSLYDIAFNFFFFPFRGKIGDKIYKAIFLLIRQTGEVSLVQRRSTWGGGRYYGWYQSLLLGCFDGQKEAKSRGRAAYQGSGRVRRNKWGRWRNEGDESVGDNRIEEAHEGDGVHRGFSKVTKLKMKTIRKDANVGGSIADFKVEECLRTVNFYKRFDFYLCSFTYSITKQRDVQET